MSSLAKSVLRAALLAPAIPLLAGCAGTPLAGEREARARVGEVARTYRPDGQKPALPALSADSSAADYLRFALLNHPRVEAAFHEWRGAVEAIAPARSLPDPQVTFQAYVTDAVTSLMPGFMVDFTTGAKRAAMGREATAESEAAYRRYVSAMADSAADLGKAWVNLAYLDDALRLRRETLELLGQSLSTAQADYATGAGMGSLEAQTRVLDQKSRLEAEIAGLVDQRGAAQAAFKSALGMRREDADPPWPAQALPAAPLPDEETLWARVNRANPELASMRSMVEVAVARADVARRARTPDFTAGLSADVKANPVLFWPTATMTLPIWRDKIVAEIAAADAGRQAAQSQLEAERVALAAEFAQALFAARAADRMIAYLDRDAQANLSRAEDSAEAGVRSGTGGFAPVVELRLMRIDLELERAAALRDRETALVDLSRLAAAGLPSAGLRAEPSLLP